MRLAERRDFIASGQDAAVAANDARTVIARRRVPISTERVMLHRLDIGCYTEGFYRWAVEWNGATLIDAPLWTAREQSYLLPYWVLDGVGEIVISVVNPSTAAAAPFNVTAWGKYAT